MSLSENDTNRIDEIENAVEEQTPVENLNEEEGIGNHSLESKDEFHDCLMGKRINLPTDEENPSEKQSGKNDDWELGKDSHPHVMGYMIPPFRRPGFVGFLRWLFGKK